MTIGKRVYGLGALVLGVPGLIYGDFAVLGLPVPAHTPAYHLLAYASAGLLVLAGLAINLKRTAPAAALALAGFFALWVLVLHLPNAIAQPTVWVSYEAVAETALMALGGLMAYTATQGERRAGLVRVAQKVFGAGLVVFGTSEFVYSKFTAAMVPAWLPPSQLAWTYLTGAAQIAAGLAVLSGVQARLAAVLLTLMYLVFSLIVHLPRVIAAPSGMTWGENGVNLILAGAAWLLAESLAHQKTRP